VSGCKPFDRIHFADQTLVLAVQSRRRIDDIVADPDEIRRLLVAQVTGTVRWRESVEAMWAAGVTDFVELGAKVLGPMVKRIAPDATVTSVVVMADIEALAAGL